MMEWLHFNLQQLNKSTIVLSYSIFIYTLKVGLDFDGSWRWGLILIMVIIHGSLSKT